MSGVYVTSRATALATASPANDPDSARPNATIDVKIIAFDGVR
jgi:hypothetical protein